jgi:ribose-phosphate pyrophosphokinase
MSENLVVLTGTANPELADAIATNLNTSLGRRELKRFPDSELHLEISETVRGTDVYLIQPTSPPVDEHLIELLFLADACRRAGAERLTALAPYFGYARQDRRASGREAVGARIAADLLANARFDRIVGVDLHSLALEGFFTVPLDHLSAVSLLANAVRDFVTTENVIVAPDLGAVKMAERFGELLHVPIAIIHKARLSGTEVRVRGVVGDVRGRKPIIVDDMITTGGTIGAAARALLSAGSQSGMTVVASHALLVGPASDRLSAIGLEHLVITDSVVPSTKPNLPTLVVSLAPMLAEVISRLHLGKTLDGLITHR